MDIGSWFAGWLSNPWLLAIGVPLVLLPIIIHLLNKRKFRIVEWAAMDFLLDADKKNRRRVRLENLILLLLRCLAVLLIAFLLARPFLSTKLTAGLLNDQFERIVLLDDSLSMQVRTGNESSLDEAKKSLIELLRELVANRADNTLTLMTTSSPEERIFNAHRISPETIDELIDAISNIGESDVTANMGLALQEIEKQLAEQSRSVTRVVYIITDMRRRDWQSETRPAGATAGATAEVDDPVKILSRLSKEVASCFLIDVGAPQQNNLVLASIRPEDTLVAGVSSRFEVAVTNPGDEEARNIKVSFTVTTPPEESERDTQGKAPAGAELAQSVEIDRIGPGETVVKPFSYTFMPREAGDTAGRDTTDSVYVKAEVVSSRPANEDRLTADSTAFYAARVVPGIPTLIVDGDPSATQEEAESFYLRRALLTPGETRSGVVVDVATEGELETLSVGKYKVIFLCNMFHLGEKTLSAIEAWTQKGGSLVIMPGDQVDENFFNKHFFNDGQGLSPLRLEGIRGDETERTWVTFKVEGTNHPMLKVFEGQNNPFLERVKTFRWWSATIHKDQKNIVSIPARFSDTEDSPAVAEKAYGQGRSMIFTIPGDHDWSSWPDDPSFVISMQELVRYLVGKKLAGEGLLRVGEPIHHPLDLTLFKTEVSVRLPDDQKESVQAVDSAAIKDSPSAASQQPGDSSDQAVWLVEYPQTQRRGFYELTLTRNNEEGSSRVLFAANVDPSEGNLKRVDAAQLKKDLGDARVTLVSGKDAGVQGSQGTQNEIWKALLFALVAVLAVEQVLGWLFGRRR